MPRMARCNEIRKEASLVPPPASKCQCGKFCKRNEVMCKTCRQDPAKRETLAILRAQERRRLYEEAVAEAEAEAVASLPASDAFTPLDGEAAILKMMRGEW